MERYVVLAHELVQLDILGVLPPLLPILGVSGSDGGVTNGGIEPDIEDLVLPARQRHRGTPFEVTGDATQLEALLEPGLGNQL